VKTNNAFLHMGRGKVCYLRLPCCGHVVQLVLQQFRTKSNKQVCVSWGSGSVAASTFSPGSLQAPTTTTEVQDTSTASMLYLRFFVKCCGSLLKMHDTLITLILIIMIIMIMIIIIISRNLHLRLH